MTDEQKEIQYLRQQVAHLTAQVNDLQKRLRWQALDPVPSWQIGEPPFQKTVSHNYVVISTTVRESADGRPEVPTSNA